MCVCVCGLKGRKPATKCRYYAAVKAHVIWFLWKLCITITMMANDLCNIGADDVGPVRNAHLSLQYVSPVWYGFYWMKRLACVCTVQTAVCASTASTTRGECECVPLVRKIRRSLSQWIIFRAVYSRPISPHHVQLTHKWDLIWIPVWWKNGGWIQAWNSAASIMGACVCVWCGREHNIGR